MCDTPIFVIFLGGGSRNIVVHKHPIYRRLVNTDTQPTHKPHKNSGFSLSLSFHIYVFLAVSFSCYYFFLK